MKHGYAAAIAIAVILPAATGFATSRSAPGATTSPRSRTLTSPGSVWDSVFTADQAKRGQALYLMRCARCHKDDLSGNADNPPLAGKDFLANWNKMTAFDLHDRIWSSMPNDSAGTLSKEQAADLSAHIFSTNGFPAGKNELGVNPDTLKLIKIEPAKTP